MTPWRTPHLMMMMVMMMMIMMWSSDPLENHPPPLPFPHPVPSQGRPERTEIKTERTKDSENIAGNKLKCDHLSEQHPRPGSHANCAGVSECARHRVPHLVPHSECATLGAGAPAETTYVGPYSVARSKRDRRAPKNLAHKTIGCRNHMQSCFQHRVSRCI